MATIDYDNAYLADVLGAWVAENDRVLETLDETILAAESELALDDFSLDF